MPGDFGSFIAKKRQISKESGQERVNVFCRLRPGNDNDTTVSQDDTVGTDQIGVTPVEDHDDSGVKVRDFDGKLKQFTFDRFFDAKATQADVFETAASKVIDSVVEGHNGTIFAYGQTGSGKTHTMLGPDSEEPGSLPRPEDEGVIPRSLRRLFSQIDAQEDQYDFKVTVSYIQIYCEILSDLLQPSNADSLVIRERSGRSNEVYISGASRFNVASADDCLRHIQVRCKLDVNSSLGLPMEPLWFDDLFCLHSLLIFACH